MNYETWAVMLWIDNDEYSQEEARLIAAPDLPREVVESAVREFVEECMMPEGTFDTATVATDLLNHALAMVDWTAVVAALREE